MLELCGLGLGSFRIIPVCTGTEGSVWCDFQASVEHNGAISGTMGCVFSKDAVTA